MEEPGIPLCMKDYGRRGCVSSGPVGSTVESFSRCEKTMIRIGAMRGDSVRPVKASMDVLRSG